jgi:hypothetical protein
MLEPAVVLGLMGLEIIEDDVDGGVRVAGDDVVHEVEELDAAATVLVRRGHLAGGHLEGGEQRRGPVALVVVAVAGKRPAVGKLQITLRPLDAWPPRWPEALPACTGRAHPFRAYRCPQADT